MIVILSKSINIQSKLAFLRMGLVFAYSLMFLIIKKKIHIEITEKFILNILKYIII